MPPVARSAGLGRAPDALGPGLRVLAFSTLIVWAALRAGAVVLTDLLVLTMGMVALALWELASRSAASGSPAGGSVVRGLGLPLTGILLGLPLALGPGAGIRGALELVLFWGALAWGAAWLAGAPKRAEVWLLRILVLLGIAQAILGLAQTLLGQMPAGPSVLPTAASGDVALGVASGSLRNPNHYATLLALTLAPAVGLLHRTRLDRSTVDRWLAWLGLLLWPFALMASRSRGGALAALGGGLVVWLGVRGWRGRHRLRGVWGGLALATLGSVVVVGAIARPRFELWGLERRLLLYGDVVRWITEAPWWGHGLGLFRWRFRPHQSFELAERYDHAHNEYLEWAAEVGVPLALLLILALVAWWSTTARRVREASDRGLRLGALLALSTVALHALLDFGTRIPLNLLLLGVLLGATLGAQGPTPRRRASVRDGAVLRRVLWALALVVLGAGMVETGRTRLALGFASLASVEGDGEEEPEAAIRRLERGLAWHPDLPSLHLRLGLLYREAPEVRSPKQARSHLERAIELNPWSWRYPRELARLYDGLGQFEPALGAHLEALARDPRSPRGHWRLAELGLRHDRPRLARLWLRRAVAGDPRFVSEVVPRWLALGGTTEDLIEAWPRSLRGELLDQLVRHSASGEAAGTLGADLDALFDDWVEGLRAPDVGLAETYLEHLLTARREPRALEAWHRLLIADLGVTPESLAQDRLWNGDFERPVLGGPLAWKIPGPRGPGRPSGERVAGAGPEGSTALRIRFESEQTADRRVRRLRQDVVVEPGERLVLSSALAAEGELTGVRLQLFDPVARQVLVEGPRVNPGEGWVTSRLPVQVGEQRRLRVRLALDRPAVGDDGAGILWIDDVSLRPEGSP